MKTLNKRNALSIALLLSLAACGPKSGKQERRSDNNTAFSSVDVPLADDKMAKSEKYDADMNEFSALEEDESFAWIDEDQTEDGFRTLHFGFDRAQVTPSEEKLLEKDIKNAKKLLADAKANNESVKIIIEGHSCHSAGSAIYNLALSEKRAKSIYDYFVAQGISRDDIKLIGRGDEVPAMVAGNKVTGNREEQAANRRVELHVTQA